LQPFLIQAQTVIDPERLTIEDGLSQGYVRSIIQDSEGFLWIGTKNGLNRYDGEHFKVFTHDPSDPYSISDDFVVELCEMGEFILVGTWNKGLNLFHKRTNRFFPIPLDPSNPDNPALQRIVNIQLDRLGQIWLSTAHLYRLRFPANFQSRFPQDVSLLDSIDIQKMSNSSGPYTNGFVIQKDHVLAANAETGKLWKVNIQSGEEGLLEEQPLWKHSFYSTLRSLSNDDLLALPMEGGGLTKNEIFLFKDGRWNTIFSDIEFNTFFLLKGKKQFCLANGKAGFIFDEKSLNKKLLKRQDAIATFSLNNVPLFDVKTDQSGNVWASTAGYGVLKITERQTKIKTYFEGTSVYAAPFVSEKGDIAISNPTTTEFLLIYGRQSNLLNLLFPDFRVGLFTEADDRIGKSDVFSNRNTPLFYTIFQDNNRDLWEVGPSHIARIKQNGSREIKHKGENGEGIDIWGLTFYDPDLNSIFFLSSKEDDFLQMEAGFFQYDIDRNKVSFYSLEKIWKGNEEVYCITKTINGHYWIGTSFGLIQAIPKDGKFAFELWNKEKDGQMGLRNNQVASLLNDPDDRDVLWIGTKGGGLHRLDTRDMSWSHINSKNGLPNDVIYGVLNDDHGNLWMSSNKGIIRYNPITGDIKNFTAADGLQSDEFNTYAYAKAPDGQMIFGGINGLNIFHPDDLQENPVTPKVLLTGLTVNNETVIVGDSTELLSEAIAYTPKITLPFSQNNISLRFAALEYTSPQKNRFQYYLKGAEKEWEHESTENIAAYLNLSPGNYTFKIKGANGDGIWSDEISSLKINILPPWWWTWWAKGIYLIIGLAPLIIIYRYQLKKKLAEQEAIQLKELDDIKSRFFTNISHEFRTPLTVISGMADQIKENPLGWAEKGTSMIKRNSANLLKLVNQILDLRKLESGALNLDMIQGDVIPYIRYVFESFHSFDESKQIKLHFQTQEAELVMDYDADKLLKIISNLLSNAIKYTDEGGEVFLEVSTKGLESLQIRIKDTSIGIPEDQLPRIFDRFYQVDDSSTRKGEGTGIGLTYTRELVKALGGQIEVESEQGKGSIFTVQLPIRQQAAPVLSQDKKEAATKLEAFTFVPEEYAPSPVSPGPGDEELPYLLIVEDHPDVVQYLIICLEGQYQIEVGRDGQEGIDKAIEKVPDIIISDVMMPRKNGYELCHTLKNDKRTSHIPIVLLTAKADEDSRITGLEKGADAYLAKPFNQKELFIRLEKLLELRQRLKQRYESLDSIPPAEDSSLLQEDAFIKKVQNSVHDHINEENYSITDLCRELGMSRAQLHRKIKALTGRSTSLFVRSIRLLKAKELLQTTDLNVSEVAYEVGFSNPKYFSRIFSEEFGQAPSFFLN